MRRNNKKKKGRKKNNRKNNRRRFRNNRTEKEVKDMLLHLEDEYRKANISEKDYKELKEKYSKGLNRMNNMAKKDPKKEKKSDKLEVGEIEEVTPEVIEKLATQLSETADTEASEEEKKKKKSGFFSRIFGKKEKPQEVETQTQESTIVPAFEEPEAEPQAFEASPTESYPTPKPSARYSVLSKKVTTIGVEIEKLKTMLETVRETGHVTEETIQTLSETIGELRSLIFQTDASLKETMIKMEKIEDDIAEVRPKEIEKKFRAYDAEDEKEDLEIEKLQKKSERAGEKINKIYEMLKSIDGIENLVNVNKKIQEKLKDVDEAVKYIGRIGAKTEKQFMDLSRGLEDLILFKAKQEDLDENLKDIIKAIDSLNVKFESYVNKKDLGVFREDIFLIKKQLENIDKVLPLVEVKIPENIIDLRKEREDILLLLDSLQEQYNNKKITKNEYKSFKEGNEKRLEEIEKELKKEWKNVEKMIRSTEKEKPEEQPKIKSKKTQPTEEIKTEEPPKEEVAPEREIEEKEAEKEVKEPEEKIEETPKKEEKIKKSKKKVRKKTKIKKKKKEKGKIKILSEIKKM